MNTRTASDISPKLPNSTAAEVDRQLAFIDNVCSLLIESRFGRKSYSPFSQFTPAADDGKDPERRWMPLHKFIRPSSLVPETDPILASSFTPPQPTRPTALATRCSSPTTSYPSTGLRAVLERISDILGTHFAKLFSATIQPRGSPA